MAKQILGKIAYISKGEYSSSKNYEINDVVTYQGSSYVSLKDTQGNLPTDENHWMLLAAKGEQGIQGEKGATGKTGPIGPQGVPGIQGLPGENYILTEEDKNTIKNEITENANSIFNQNAVSKTDAFNSNANTKTQVFNENVETQTNEFVEVVNSTLSSFESETSQYVKNTDYANANKGGVIRNGNQFTNNNGIPFVNTMEYNSYENSTNGAFIGKGTLENVIAGKKLISETNYPTTENAGVIKTGYCFGVATNGIPVCGTIPYSTYQNALDGIFIGKGTLENVLNAKIGSIDTILDTINGEVI